MQFTVATWRIQGLSPADAVKAWLAHTDAFTMMASPPRWAKEHHRNLDLFAPPANIVFGYKDHHVSQADYIDVYRGIMKQRLSRIDQWIAAQANQHITLLCACPDGQFCHRLLLAKLLLWRGCEEVAP